MMPTAWYSFIRQSSQSTLLFFLGGSAEADSHRSGGGRTSGLYRQRGNHHARPAGFGFEVSGICVWSLRVGIINEVTHHAPLPSSHDDANVGGAEFDPPTPLHCCCSRSNSEVARSSVPLSAPYAF